MLMFEAIAEKRIAEALERGELSGLPGEGKPLELDDDTLIPEELRLACRILKNAGFVPPEVERIRNIRELQRLIPTLDDNGERRRLMLRLNLLTAQTAAGRRHGDLRIEDSYQAVEKRRERTSGKEKSGEKPELTQESMRILAPANLKVTLRRNSVLSRILVSANLKITLH